MATDPSDVEVRRLMQKNAELIKENNELLKKIHRNGVWGLWVRVVWYMLLIGIPFALYFYILEPYFEALGSSFDVFNAGIQEIPGLKQFREILNAAGTSTATTTME